MNMIRNPDCRDGKHPACNGDAWDFDRDSPTPCECPCHWETLNEYGEIAS